MVIKEGGSYQEYDDALRDISPKMREKEKKKITFWERTPLP